MDKLSAYSSPKALGHRLVEDVLKGAIVVQEKIDGSQISFGVVDGMLVVRSRNVQLHAGKEKMFNKAFEHLETVKHLMHEGFIYRGEYLNKRKHNTLMYERVPNGYIVLFDVEKAGRNYLSQTETQAAAATLSLDYAPVYYTGDGSNLRYEFFEGMVETQKPILGGSHIEGVVIKNYDQWLNEKVMMAKLVSPKFKEVHGNSWKERNPTGIEQLKMSINREAIWAKAIQHLKEEGVLLGEPKDIGPLMKELNQDFTAENEEFVKEELYRIFKKEILRYVGKGFPEFYKEYLARGSMPNQEE